MKIKTAMALYSQNITINKKEPTLADVILHAETNMRRWVAPGDVIAEILELRNEVMELLENELVGKNMRDVSFEYLKKKFHPCADHLNK